MCDIQEWLPHDGNTRQRSRERARESTAPIGRSRPGQAHHDEPFFVKLSICAPRSRTRRSVADRLSCLVPLCGVMFSQPAARLQGVRPHGACASAQSATNHESARSVESHVVVRTRSVTAVSQSVRRLFYERYGSSIYPHRTCSSSRSPTQGRAGTRMRCSEHVLHENGFLEARRPKLLLSTGYLTKKPVGIANVVAHISNDKREKRGGRRGDCQGGSPWLSGREIERRRRSCPSPSKMLALQ